MTFGEVQNAIDSRNRTEKLRMQERASMDYILADLIGRSIARVYSSANHMPEIGEVYPTLFDTKEIEEQKQAKKAELSALRFKQFANSYNAKFNKGGSKVTNG